jgi:hypothetical protein
MSESGGRFCTIVSCRRRGWLDAEDKLTDSGTEVLKSSTRLNA